MRKIIFLLWLCTLGALCVKVGDVGFYLLAAALLSALAGLLSNLFTQKSVTAEVFADGFFEKGEKKNITIKISGLSASFPPFHGRGRDSYSLVA